MIVAFIAVPAVRRIMAVCRVAIAAREINVNIAKVRHKGSMEGMEGREERAGQRGRQLTTGS